MKMDCPCPLCTGRDLFRGYNQNTGEFENEVEVEEVKSIYDRLSEVSDQLNKFGVPADFINKLNQLCEDIDEIDSEVLAIGKLDKSGELQFKLGKLSQKLM
jgi:hypothetical protein